MKISGEMYKCYLEQKVDICISTDGWAERKWLGNMYSREALMVLEYGVDSMERI